MHFERLSPVILAAVGLALAAGSASALTIDTTATTDDTSFTTTGVGGNANSVVDASSVGAVVLADTVGATVTVTPRVRGYAVARNDSVSSGSTAEAAQAIDITFAYDITAPGSVAYDLIFAPEFHGILRINDSGLAETLDSVSFQGLQASLNGAPVSDLDLGSYTSRSTDGFTVVDFLATGTTVSGSGNATFELNYSLNLADNPLLFQAIAGSTSCPHSAAALWGMDAPNGCALNSTFEYADGANRAADGLFGAATLLITSVPETGTALLVGPALLGLRLRSRRTPRA